MLALSGKHKTKPAVGVGRARLRSAYQPGAWWLLNEGGGPVGRDLFGRSFDFTLNGGVGWGSVKPPGSTGHSALRFPGTGLGDYANAPAPSGFSSTSAWSVFIRARFIGTPALENLFNLVDGSGNSACICYWDSAHNGMMTTIQGGGSGFGTSLAANPDITLWHNWTFTADGVATRCRIYCDGVDLSNLGETGTVGPQTDVHGLSLSRGLQSGAYAYSTMHVDEVRFWPGYALTPGEVATISEFGYQGIRSSARVRRTQAAVASHHYHPSLFSVQPLAGVC